MAGIRNAVRAVIRRPLVIGVCVLVVLGALNLWLWRVHDASVGEDATAMAAVEAASQSLPTVLSYSAPTINEDLYRAAELLTGNFKKEFEALGRSTIVPAAQKDKISTSAVATEIGVIDVVSDDEVNLLVFVNQTTTRKGTDQPTQAGARIEVTMSREDGEWLISSLEPV